MKSIRIIIVSTLLLAASGCGAQTDADKTQDSAYTAARAQMVQEQIQRRGIEDERVLAALGKVERHRFVLPKYQKYAYIDDPLPIDAGQTISQPYIVALMTELLQLAGDEKVLEIGTGSGYQAAILGELVEEVYTIEIIDTLGVKASRLLRKLGYDNIEVRIGDGYRGWPDQAPFDAIIITAAPPKVPQPLLDQLADGGRMVVPVGKLSQDLMLIEREGETFNQTKIAPVRFVPMTGEAQK
ncbi:MAG: protein-L-isoaspartate(D-aspartate) O-methyltransferase [bacterium]|nr:protein-L-isoaspartate(D-aspartate) O-methyltransferase [bacterium]